MAAKISGIQFRIFLDTKIISSRSIVPVSIQVCSAPEHRKLFLLNPSTKEELLAIIDFYFRASCVISSFRVYRLQPQRCYPGPDKRQQFSKWPVWSDRYLSWATDTCMFIIFAVFEPCSNGIVLYTCSFLGFTVERTLQFLFALLVQLANAQTQREIWEPHFFIIKL